MMLKMLGMNCEKQLNMLSSTDSNFSNINLFDLLCYGGQKIFALDSFYVVKIHESDRGKLISVELNHHVFVHGG